MKISYWIIFTLLFGLAWNIEGPLVSFEDILNDGVDIGIITKNQMSQLIELIPKHYVEREPEEIRYVNVMEGQNIFVHKPSVIEITKEATFKTFGYVSEGLTLLNVLYFGGGVVVMGSMSLFITTGFALFEHAGLFFIGGSYVALFQILAYILWYSVEDFKILSGIFATISIGICPFVIFSFLNLAGKKPQDFKNYRSFHQFVSGSFVPIEIGTAIFGFFTILLIPFPFITMPISFCLWYLTMDITEYFYGKNFSFKERAKTSVGSGFVMILFGLFLEFVVQPSTDFSFWIYLFGLIAFWFGLTFMGEGKPVGRFIYSVIQIVLILVSHPSLLDRYMFCFWGGIGMFSVYTVMVRSLFDTHGNRTVNYRNESFWVFCMFVPAIFLLFGSTSLNAVDEVIDFFSTRSVMYFSALYAIGCCQVIYQAFIVISAPWMIRYLHLYFFMGMLCSLEVFRMNITIPIFESVLQWTFPSLFGVEILCILSSLAYCTPMAPGILGSSQLSAFVEIIFGLWLAIYNSIYLYSSGFPITVETTIRLSLIILGSGVILIRDLKHLLAVNTITDKIVIAKVYMYTTLLSMIAVFIFDSTLLLLIPTALFTKLVFSADSSWHSKSMRNIVVGVMIIMLAIALNSKLIIVVGAFSVLACINRIAQTMFRDSLLFPIYLSFVGLWIIGLGVLYQLYYETLREKLFAQLSYIPIHKLGDSVLLPIFMTLSNYIHSGFLWLYAMANFIQDKPNQLIIIAAIVMLFVSFLIWFKVNIFDLRKNLNEDAMTHVHITSVKVTTRTSTEGHGFAVHLKGQKPPNLTINNAWLHIDDDTFWRQLENIAPAMVIQIFRSSMHPIALCPQMLKCEDFKQGESEFSTIVEFGTSEPARISHSTLISRLRSISNSKPKIRVVFQSADFESSSMVTVKSGFLGLFGKEVKIGNLCAINIPISSVIASHNSTTPIAVW